LEEGRRIALMVRMVKGKRMANANVDMPKSQPFLFISDHR